MATLKSKFLILDNKSELRSDASPENVIGKSTVDSIRSGAVYGFAGMIENLVRQIKKELGQNAHVVATGGIVDWIASKSTVIDTLDPFLTLDGMRIIYEKNHPKKPK